MTQHLANDLGIDPVEQQYSRTGVTQIMEPNLWYAGFVCEGLKAQTF